MTYMKNGGLIRLVADCDVARLARMGFVPLAAQEEKPTKKPARKPKEEKPNANV